MSLCEIRITTYKRPQLLKRSLDSVIAQTHDNWSALVFDDSPEQEAKAVVETYQDSRIIYKPHSKNIGCSKNLDYAFQSKAYVGGEYAFVLEDDNYLFPNFISENIKIIEETGINIVLRNQEWRLEENGSSVATNRTTRGQWFYQGSYSPIELRSRLFFCEGISNGGLFWQTNKIKSNLQVGTQVKHPWHQELFRTLRIEESIWFGEEPLCAFTEFARNDTTSIKLAPELPAKLTRGSQSIWIFLLKKYGDLILSNAENIADKQGAKINLERHLVNAFYFKYKFTELTKLEIYKILTKASLRYVLFEDPFKNAWSTL
ncbi:glycosyltransferase family 2 protein [Gloeothece verrucosa]|uniref:Glycosyl transferase family 2 n=1 Tax=Gloeothece verrucosa (strain PCC 7822) TaxID=497965 RepID=E0UKW0_GLOV7|nr:glycosyltransferase family 2 protein [Gloeothece verrucosa]ADN17590.1 glycosyl transferase family 2 [Gloeothece verrucosa PCC 7822]